MKRVTACIALAAMIVGCNEGGVAPPPLEDLASAKGIRMSTPAPVEYFHDTIQLTPEGGAPGVSSLVAGPAAVEGGDGVHYNLIRVARIPPPQSGVQANDILIGGSTAYIAYNYQGVTWAGAIQAYDISDPETPAYTYQYEIPSMDINALGLDGTELLVTGAADPAEWPELEGAIAFATHLDAGSPDLNALVTNAVGLPSFAGTGIRRFGSEYYVGTGAQDGGIQILDLSFNLDRTLAFPDVRDIDVSGLGVLAVAGATDAGGGAGAGVIMAGGGGDPTVISIDNFGSDYHKATVEVFGGNIALLGLSEAGFKVLDVGSQSFIHEEPNPTPLIDGLLTNTNSASTNGTFIVTANGEYGFRVLRPNDGQFDDIDVVGYFASELPPQGSIEDKFSVNHVAMSNNCFFAAAGAWGVYVYCLEAALPEVSVTKTATPNTVGWGSGGLGDFVPDRTFTEDGDGIPPDEFFFGASTCDDAGPDDQPNQVDFNCMARADNVTGLLGLRWTWDATGVWTGSGQTGDGCALLDSDEDGDANFAACVRIENDPETGDIRQVGGDGAVFFYSCGDGRVDRCSTQIALLEDVGEATTCSIELVANSLEGSGNANSQDDPDNDVQATCALDLSLFEGAERVNLLNVCAYPSGEPNSNPFDCVVTPGVGFIRILKLVDPDITDLFGFTMSPASTDGTSKYAVASGVITALIPVTPGSDYSLSELLPSGWFLDTAACTVNDEGTGELNFDLAQITGVAVSSGQTTLCTFENFASTDGSVTFEVVVTNLGGGFEPVTLDSLVDDVFGDLNGVEGGDCVTGGTIAVGASYTCSFTRTLTGAPGDTHTNTVTAVASDDDGSDTESDSETVTFVVNPEDPEE